MRWYPIFVEDDKPTSANRMMANKLDQAIEKIKNIQDEARKKPAEEAVLSNWPVILLRTKKGWTGPKEYDGKMIEGSFRSHQVPLPINQYHMEEIDLLENWLRSYKPEELFTENGQLVPELQEIAPPKEKLMSLNPIT